jgi:predicted membrane protein
MLKPVLQLAAVGIAGVVLLKLAALLVFPLLGILFKILLVCAVVYFAMRLLRKRKDGEAPAT